ncbi:streptogrisin C [Lipingzhangella halophila]|uniref:Streptogrisin C n=1 Tax=Lipingzhangella halophila TaxID=1783352 RepID=A0A7W7RD91_9ACTN|nr:S1 family peptidase [Lipingzhangella halophila]MBB4929854.1 streptogrisin C [Lipingzhangella halophila]
MTSSTASAAEPSTAQGTAQELASAMERDLGLTSAEAQERLDHESEARSINSELRSELGDSWAGSFFDGDSGELTVAVTDDAATDTIASAGANPEVVSYSEDELNAIVADLDAQGSQTGDGIAGWYPDSEANAVVVEVLEGQEAAAEDLVAEAGVDPGAVEVAQTSEQPRLYADIVGGNPYEIAGTGLCSVGFAVEGGFVTAGHCGSAGTNVASQDGSGTGTVANSQFPGADMGHVAADSNWVPTPAVNDYEGGTISVAGSQESPVGASVCRSGTTTGFHCGEIRAKGQTVQYAEGQVQNLTRTNVCAEPGDSGGSWLTDNQAQGVTSGGSGNCTIGGITFFQPIGPILDEFGLTLVTS